MITSPLLIQASDQRGDLDLGSGGLVALEIKDNTGTNHKLLVLAGKDKKIYVADRNKLGKQTSNNSGIYQVIGPVMPQEVFGPGAFLNGAMYWGPRSGNPIEMFVFSNAKLGTSPAAKSTVKFNVQGTVPALALSSIQPGSLTAAWSGQSDFRLAPPAERRSMPLVRAP